MLIVCPHCETSYQVGANALGAGGRDVRCARCRNGGRAMRDTRAMADALTEAADAIGGSPMASAAVVAEPAPESVPVIESPSIVNDAAGRDPQWTAPQIDSVAEPAVAKAPKARKTSGFAGARPSPRLNLKVAVMAMAALAAALVVWRADVVRLLPQTAAFFRLAGLDVNLRSLRFEGVRVSSESVDGKPVLIIEGAIVGTGRDAVEVPRLRFVVRDPKGTEIYGWNAIIDQNRLKFGERAQFRSRLASPPADAHDLTVRFFNRRDLADGKA